MPCPSWQPPQCAPSGAVTRRAIVPRAWRPIGAAIRRKREMPALDTALIVLGGIALFAAFVNGAIGYGFSSLTVPLALVFYTNRILNPAVVLIEVFLNLYVLI